MAWRRTEIVGALRLAVLFTAATMFQAPDGAAIDRPPIGIAMPNTNETRWIADGNSLSDQLRALGYEPDLRNAGNDAARQIDQITNMVARGDRALIIAPVDDLALSEVLHAAAARGTRIIAYDRLIRGSPDVDYFVSFDSYAVGVLQAESLVDGLRKRADVGVFDIELFAGSPNDRNAHEIFTGAMSIIQPLIDNHTVRVNSGEVSFNDVATLRWNANDAHARLDNLLTAYYGLRDVAGILAPNDEIAQGLINSLRSAGYGLGAKQMPIITGQDCEIAAVRAIEMGLQYSSVFKDTRDLASRAAQVVDAVIKRREIPVNSHYNNGMEDVSSFLLPPQLVTKSNLREILIGSHYYRESELNSSE